MFAWDAEEGRIVSEHHPFTSPNFDDFHLVEKEPLKVRSLSYDLVLNGYEIASGSQRIHDPDLQHKIFETLQLTPAQIESKFGFFVRALSYGTHTSSWRCTGLGPSQHDFDQYREYS